MRLGIRIDRRETTEDTKRRVPLARGRLGFRVKGSAVALKGFHPGEARDTRGAGGRKARIREVWAGALKTKSGMRGNMCSPVTARKILAR
jgi:hypothetical protein